MHSYKCACVYRHVPHTHSTYAQRERERERDTLCHMPRNHHRKQPLSTQPYLFTHAHMHTCRYSLSHAKELSHATPQHTTIFMHTCTHAHTQILAVTCQGTISSKSSAQSFVVTPAPIVLVTVTIDGLSADQVTAQVESQLVAAVADSIGVARLSVKLLSFRNARRRLPALVVTCQILAVDADEAKWLQQKIAGTDIQVCVYVHMV
jgi:hypothetical protein